MIKHNTFKKTVSVLLAVALLTHFSLYLLAFPANAVTPRWASILSVEVSMGFDGDEGTVSGIARKKSTATMIEGTVYLYELDGDEWVYIDEWHNSKSVGTLAVSGIFACESGNTYKAVFVVTAYTANTPESETVEYIEICP